VNNPSVAIIDTGIDLDHPDLNVLGGKNCQSGSSYDDGNGHGTHVAGTVAAKDDSNGVVGMAPGAPLYAVRVLNNSGSGSWSAIICGIDWVTQNAASKGIKVANMSLGGSGSDGSCNSEALHLAICNSVNKGVTYVVAAGNSNKNLSGFVPAAYNEVLTVTAMADFNGQPGGGAAATCRSDVDETPADFSNFTRVDNSTDVSHTIAAPGVCIRSTWKGGGYKTISGTSMASPHVAGTAALCIANGTCSGLPSDIIVKLRNDAAAQPASYGFTGDPNSPINTRYYGHLVYAGGY
jgi:subtilisin